MERSRSVRLVENVLYSNPTSVYRLSLPRFLHVDTSSSYASAVPPFPTFSRVFSAFSSAYPFLLSPFRFGGNEDREHPRGGLISVSFGFRFDFFT